MTEDTAHDEDQWDEEHSNLVKHALREMELAGIPQEDRDKIMPIIRTFASQGHSGGSAGWYIVTLVKLLQFENLTSLTDNPNEWNKVSEEHSHANGPLHQSQRNPEAFSTDGGKTYYLLSENPNPQRPDNFHTSTNHLKRM